MISQDPKQFEITLGQHSIEVHTTARLVDKPNLRDHTFYWKDVDRKGLDDVAKKLVGALFAGGVNEIEIRPYYFKIKVAKLFDLNAMHEAVEKFIWEQWPEATIYGQRYEAQEAYVHFVITAGPGWDIIRRVLDGNNPEGDPNGWEELQFTGHKPDSALEETLVMKFGSLRGWRDLGGFTTDDFRDRPPQGERVMWDLIPAALSIGPKPTADQLKWHYKHPDATSMHGVFVRFNDVTGTGEVLDLSELKGK